MGQDLVCLVHCFVPAPNPVPDAQCIRNREASKLLSYLKATKSVSTISFTLMEDMRLWVRNEGQLTNHNRSSSHNTGTFAPVPWADPSPVGWQQKAQMIAALTAGLWYKTWTLSAENPKSGTMTLRVSVLHSRGRLDVYFPRPFPIWTSMEGYSGTKGSQCLSCKTCWNTRDPWKTDCQQAEDQKIFVNWINK